MVEAVVQRSIQWKDMEGSGTRRAAVCIPASLFVASHQDLNTSHGCPSYGEESKASTVTAVSHGRKWQGKGSESKISYP